jgi:hypothetical protein
MWPTFQQENKLLFDHIMLVYGVLRAELDSFRASSLKTTVHMSLPLCPKNVTPSQSMFLLLRL